MFRIFFYNTGYVKEGFQTVADALNHLKDCCFEGCIENEARECIVSWSPINGIRWYQEGERDV